MSAFWISGVSLVHLFNGVCSEKVTPSDGVKIATEPLFEALVSVVFCGVGLGEHATVDATVATIMHRLSPIAMKCINRFLKQFMQSLRNVIILSNESQDSRSSPL